MEREARKRDWNPPALRATPLDKGAVLPPHFVLGRAPLSKGVPEPQAKAGDYGCTVAVYVSGRRSR
jgi:hypothetical protein